MFFVFPTQIIITSIHIFIQNKKGRTTNPITENKSKTTNKFLKFLFFSSFIYIFFLQHKHIHNTLPHHFSASVMPRGKEKKQQPHKQSEAIHLGRMEYEVIDTQ